MPRVASSCARRPSSRLRRRVSEQGQDAALIGRRGVPADLLDVRDEAPREVVGFPWLRVPPRQVRELVELLDAVRGTHAVLPEPGDGSHRRRDEIGQKFRPLDVSSYARSRRSPVEPSGDALAEIPEASPSPRAQDNKLPAPSSPSTEAIIEPALRGISPRRAASVSPVYGTRHESASRRAAPTGRDEQRGPEAVRRRHEGRRRHGRVPRPGPARQPTKFVFGEALQGVERLSGQDDERHSIRGVIRPVEVDEDVAVKRSAPASPRPDWSSVARLPVPNFFVRLSPRTDRSSWSRRKPSLSLFFESSLSMASSSRSTPDGEKVGASKNALKRSRAPSKSVASTSKW